MKKDSPHWEFGPGQASGARVMEVFPAFYFVERGWLNGNHFVFKGDRTVLIDSGYLGHIEYTLAVLQALGVSPEEVDLIVTTHTHCDHVGAHAFIQEKSGCPVTLSPIDKYFIDTRNDWFTWWRYYDQEARFFRTGPPLKEGDVLRLGQGEFRVIHTPGHASGAIALFDPAQEILISSDALWSHDLGGITPRIEGNMAVFLALESLDKLERLRARRAYPGHGPVIDDVPAAIERCRQRLRGYLEDPARQGRDQIKKIIIYILLMREGFAAEAFFPYLKSTHWYPETVDLFLGGRYHKVFQEVMDELMGRGVVFLEEGIYKTRVKP